MSNNNKEQSQDFVASFVDLVMLLGKYENELQATRELLTLRNNFNPENLFKYLCMGQEELTRAHIMYFMEENNKQIKEEEAKLLLTVYGYKEKLTYSDFLDYVYPFDIDAIKTISTVNCKKYVKNEDGQPTQEVLCIFLLLIVKQLEFLHAFDEFKTEKLPNANRQSIKKWIKLLKKSVPQSGGISSNFVFTFPEFKTIMKKLKNMPQRKVQPICRRLSLQKESFIGIDQLQIWLKSWFKQKPQDSVIAIPQNTQTLFEDITQGTFP